MALDSGMVEKNFEDHVEQANNNMGWLNIYYFKR